MVTFRTSIWRFSETGTLTLRVGNLASSAMTLELFRFFLLKKFNIVMDLHDLQIFFLKKMFHYFHISQFYTPTKKKGLLNQKKKILKPK